MNYFYQLLTSTIVGLMSFVTSVFIAQQIGPVNFGIYCFYLFIGYAIIVLIDGGFKTILFREGIISSKNIKIPRDLLPIIASSHSFSICILLSILTLFFFEKYLLNILSVIFCFYIISLTQFASSILRGQTKLAIDSIWLLKNRLLSCIFILLCIYLEVKEVWQIFISWGISLLFVNFFSYEGFHYKPNLNIYRKYIYKLYPGIYSIMLIDLATIFYFRSDLLILKYHTVNDFEIGHYSAAFKIIEGILLLINPISILIFKKFRINIHNKQESLRLLKRYLIFGFFIGIIFYSIIIFSTNLIITATFGNLYADSSEILCVLSLMTIFLVPNLILTQSILAFNLEKYYSIVAISAAILNISCNYFFIPYYGVFGSAYISVATEVFIFSSIFIYIYFIFSKK